MNSSSERHRIPAATIEGIDLASVAKDSPADADEIKVIGHSLAVGTETTEDIIRLCDLLYKHGKLAESEELLRCNVLEANDKLYQAYTRLFGLAADEQFKLSLSVFETQFDVKLKTSKQLGFLKLECSSIPAKANATLDSDISLFLSHPCVIQFSYDSTGCIADVCSSNDDLSERSYLILEVKNGIWTQKESHII